MYKKK